MHVTGSQAKFSTPPRYLNIILQLVENQSREDIARELEALAARVRAGTITGTISGGLSLNRPLPHT